MVKTNRSCVCLVMLIVSLAAQTELFSQQAKFKDLKFSKEEVELLKRWKQIEDGATIASSMLKATPFVELFTATKPHEQLVTVTMNDWDLIGAAIKGLGQVKACQVVKEIDLFTVDVLGEPAKTPNAPFFAAVRARYDQSC